MMNNNAIRTLERMNNIIEEMKKLREEFETLMCEEKEEKYEETYEDLDSFEFLTDEELEGLLNDELDDEFEDDYDFDCDDEEEEDEDIYKVYLSEEEFTMFYEITNSVPYGYVHDKIDNEFLVILDEDMKCDVEELLDKQHYYEKYENCCSSNVALIIDIMNEIYLQTR